MKNIITTFFALVILTSLSFAQTEGELNVTLTTSNAGGNYNPKNIVAIWIEDDAGNFVKTLMAYAQNRRTHLNTWEASTSAAGSAFNTADAITGPTKTNHATRTCSWNATNIAGEIVMDGDYEIWMELTDKNSTGNYSHFTITKGETAQTITPTNVPSFESISLNWVPETTSIDQDNIVNNIITYPNPTSDNFSVIGDNIDFIEVFAITGKTVYKGKSNKIDISEQPAGYYFVKITTNNKSIYKKVQKQ